jgi:signal transduction histidine kinase
LAETAEAVRRGDAGERFPTGGRDEIGELATTLENMRATLQEQVGIISRQSEELQGASQRIATVRDVERRRLARDLHDGVQQQLVMLRLRVRLMDGDIEPEELAEIGRSVERVIEQLRETSQAIYPSILADRGLTGALYSLAATSALPIELALAPDPLPRFAEPVEGGVYFMVAEAITNVVKHAQAAEARVTVRVAGALLTLLVCDDGVGFDPAVRTSGSGVQNLRDRAAALGGLAGIRSEPGLGTAVAVAVPLGPDSVVGALEEEQDRRDTPVEVVGVAQAQLLEDGVGMLLDRAFTDDECVGDG